MNSVMTTTNAFSGRRTVLSLVLASALCAPLPGIAQTYTQTEDITYHDNTSKWVLGQVATRVVNGTTVSASTYDTTYGLPLTFRSFGKLQETLTWDTSASLASGLRGTLKTVKDGNNNITTLGSWKRGFPQTITFADASSKSAVVNDAGWITSVTDETGSKTCYAYDVMGRLTTLTQPSETATNVCNTSAWSATTLVFEKATSAKYGIPAGHWRQTVSTGNARMIRYFDQMWRPLVTEEYDAGNEAATKRFQRFAYHPDGQVSFASYPGTSDALTTGTWTEYDVLGRTTAVAQDSELGLLTSTTEYLDGFRTRTTNPRGFQTTTAYQVFDEPGYDRPTAIAHPLGAYTHITRDVFGKTTKLRRSNSVSPTGGTGINRTYTYNGNQELCRVVEPETGATLMGYDSAGNLAWSAKGLASGTACHATGLTSTISPYRVARTYDARNRLALVDYPDSTPDVATTYTPNGKVATISRSPTLLSYSYNKRGLLASERLEYGSINWLTSHSYDSLGNLAVSVYPSGLQVPYAPNALGQATQAGSYATNATYYPNGALKQFTYGNDIVHTMTQNARQLPESSRDVFGWVKILDDTYDYDANGNVLGISDALSGQPGNRDMSYDALDRLTGVTAGSAQGGNAAFSYDVLDNLTALDQGSRQFRYVYDANNRLAQIKSPTGAVLHAFGYDARGNTTSKDGGSLVFDLENRLTSSQLPTSTTYVYDGMGRRVREFMGASTYFYYGQGGKLLYTNDHKTSTRTDHIYLAGSLVANRKVPFGSNPTIEVAYQHTDALGSPVAETSESATVLRRERMTAYGEPADGTWTSGPGFTGHQMDAGSKLIYMQQRYYDPLIGRFISSDPVDADPNSGRMFNRYLYANSNPLGFVDPDGRAPKGCGSGKCSEDGRNWRSVSLRARALARGNAVRSSGGAAPQGAKTFGPLKGAFVKATAKPTQPIKYERKAHRDENPISLGLGWTSKVHILLIGGSITTSGSLNSNGEACGVAVSCLTIGPGLYAGTGPNAQVGVGNLESQDMIFGVNAEAALLGGVGGDVDFNGAGAALSGGGRGGEGAMIAAKICSVDAAIGAACE